MAGEPYDYFGAMGGAANIGGVPQAVNSAILGQQVVQDNQGKLDAQQRANDARTIQGVLVANPNMDDAHFEALTNHLATIDPPAAYAAKIARQEKAAVGQWLQNPNARSTAQLIAQYPGVAAQVEKPWAMMDAAQKDATLKASTDVYGYLSAGNTDAAVQTLQQHMDSAAKTGEDVSAYPQLIQLIKTNRKGALGLAALNLSAGMGHDKFAEVYGKVNPAIQRQEGAKATQEEVKANTLPAVIGSNLADAEANRNKIAADIANQRAELAVSQGRLALDTNRLATETQLKLAELEQKGADLPEDARKIVNESAASAAEAQMSASKFNSLADRMDAAKIGAYGGWKETVKSVFGDQNAVTQLRAEWQQMRNKAALLGRKDMPGAMSDADRQFLLAGFPSDNANPAYIARFLRTMAKAQEVVAANEDGKAQWVSRNATLGPARRPIVVDGMRIPAGMTFSQYQAAMAKIRPSGLPDDAKSVVERAKQ